RKSSYHTKAESGFLRRISVVSLKPLSGTAILPFTSLKLRGESSKVAEPAEGRSENDEQRRKPYNCAPITPPSTVMVCSPADKLCSLARATQKVLLQYGHHRRLS